MGKLRLILLLFFAFSFSALKADTGCLLGSYIYIYRFGNYTGNPPGSYPNGSYRRYDYLFSSERVLESAVFCKVTSSEPCRVTGGASGWGTLISCTVVQCPIDDYVSFLILPIGILGFSYLKRKQNI